MRMLEQVTSLRVDFERVLLIEEIRSNRISPHLKCNTNDYDTVTGPGRPRPANDPPGNTLRARETTVRKQR
jgi:hypothetical protein